MHARPFSPLMFIEQEPQMPSRHDLHGSGQEFSHLRMVNVWSMVSLMYSRASKSMWLHLQV